MFYVVRLWCHIYLDINLDINRNVHRNVHRNINLDINLDINLNVNLNAHLDINLDINLDAHQNVHQNLYLTSPLHRFSTSASLPRSSVRQCNQSPVARLSLFIYRELALVETVESNGEGTDFLDIAVEIRGGDYPRAFQTELHVSNDQF